MGKKEFEKVGKTSDIPPGEASCYTVGETLIGIYNVAGEFFAINDLCPHMGASLSAGHLEGESVSCPWHAWRFCVRDGTWLDNRKLSVDTYEVKIDGENLLVATEPNPKEDIVPNDKGRGAQGGENEGGENEGGENECGENEGDNNNRQA